MLNALRRVFKKMIGSDTAVGRPMVLRAWREEPHWVVGVISVQGDEHGAFAVYLADETADAIVRDLGVNGAHEMHESVARETALREIVRMMVSIARRDPRLNRIELGTPVVRSTGPIGDMPQKLRPWVTVPVATSVGQVMVALSLMTKKGAEDLSPADAGPVLESIA